jgi:hypothetical protein
MANDGSYKSNNDDNNGIESPPSTHEQLLIIQNQLLQTVQQILVQMQDVNQLMQSIEGRPSSRKRKSNTHDNSGKAQKINITERQHPITKKVRCVLIADGLVILPINAPIDVSVLLLLRTPTDLKLLWVQPKSEEIESATIVDRKVTSLNRAPTHILVLL